MTQSRPPSVREVTAAFDARLSAALGGREQPELILTVLDELGLPGWYIPPEYGGRPVDHEELLALWSVLAQRDASAAVAHGATCLGAAPVWLAGDGRLAAELAEAMLGGDRGGLAVAEPEHGVDPGNEEVLAERTAAGYRLTGSKWPVLNATRGQFISVLARTGPPGDLRGHSLLLVRKDRVAAADASLLPLPAAPLHGLRGADVSGISFAGATVPGSALIGVEGGGVETLLRTLQLTRTVSSALSLGVGAHALRLVAECASRRAGAAPAGAEGCGRPPIEQHFVRAALARCAGLLAAAEAAAVLTARSAHCLTEELSVLSVLVKGLVPTLVEAVLDELGELIAVGGAPGAVAPEFQRIRQDHHLIALLDGSAASARSTLIRRFPVLVRGFLHADVNRRGLALAADLGTRVGPLDRSRLAHRSDLGCSAVQTLPRLALDMEDRAGAPGSATSALAGYTRGLTQLADELHARCAEVVPGPFPAAEAYDTAAAYELLYAGAAVLHLWRAGAAEHGGRGLWREALWARAALAELCPRLRHRIGLAGAPRDERGEPAAEKFADLLVSAAAAGRPLTPFDYCDGSEGAP
jgi:alkylation response protein AidB-like acyl-CoA dehydrogenase